MPPLRRFFVETAPGMLDAPEPGLGHVTITGFHVGHVQSAIPTGQVLPTIHSSSFIKVDKCQMMDCTHPASF
jgi:hypothetical protein